MTFLKRNLTVLLGSMVLLAAPFPAVDADSSTFTAQPIVADSAAGPVSCHSQQTAKLAPKGPPVYGTDRTKGASR